MVGLYIIFINHTNSHDASKPADSGKTKDSRINIVTKHPMTPAYPIPSGNQKQCNNAAQLTLT
ncbi:hypothetical protein HYFRA_00011738 [Hymenoscyphus fraxineus]|uniref:Uncharacterized protein n=1 Tax=Hymenoscyphus fraxineus TaxID=746836 RepID=A0A9N9L620_9HELO|nr:hypothetical protein HYFRA_00011738 [Hymenoscyphus fraxineus]